MLFVIVVMLWNRISLHAHSISLLKHINHVNTHCHESIKSVCLVFYQYESFRNFWTGDVLQKEKMR
uniref:RxLR effector candidate protein n=1 Tax=Hyaloperonospora arabidopsidis (strain Emoy2) TaxID=559515 RepID=M4B8M1_HYAAE